MAFYEACPNGRACNFRLASATASRSSSTASSSSPGRDFRREGGELVFDRPLAREGRLGFWRWLSLFLGVAGTYRQNDSVDVVYQSGGRRIVATSLPLAHED